MIRLLAILPLVFLLCFAYSCQKGEEGAEEFGEDAHASAESIREWFDRYTSGMSSGDVDDLLSLYADSIVILPPSGSIVAGRDEYRNWIDRFLGRYNTEENLEIREIKIYGKNAAAWGSHNYRITHKESGIVTEGTGTFINLFELHSNGEWMCTHNMWTSVSPPAKKEE